MSIEDDERYMYDDGRFADDGEEERDDDFDIPTYDELDLEGRYYTYGSREEYNEWRYYKIQELKEEREIEKRKEQYIRRMKRSKKPNEYNDVEIPDYDSLSQEEKERCTSRKDYEMWREHIIRSRRIHKNVSAFSRIASFVIPILVFLFILLIISFLLS